VDFGPRLLSFVLSGPVPVNLVRAVGLGHLKRSCFEKKPPQTVIDNVTRRNSGFCEAMSKDFMIEIMTLDYVVAEFRGVNQGVGVVAVSISEVLPDHLGIGRTPDRRPVARPEMGIWGKLPGKETGTINAVERQADDKVSRFAWRHPRTMEDRALLAGVVDDGIPLGIKPILQGNLSCLVHHISFPQ
jgi:hypothetical protein